MAQLPWDPPAQLPWHHGSRAQSQPLPHPRPSSRVWGQSWGQRAHPEPPARPYRYPRADPPCISKEFWSSEAKSGWFRLAGHSMGTGGLTSHAFPRDPWSRMWKGFNLKHEFSPLLISLVFQKAQSTLDQLPQRPQALLCLTKNSRDTTELIPHSQLFLSWLELNHP